MQEFRMSVRKVGFVGFRSSDLAGLRRIFEEGFGFRPTDIAEDQVGYSTEDGTRVEAYSETNAFHEFFTTGPVIGFTVEDFDIGWRKLTRLGIDAITEIQEVDGRKWVHFRLPDGTVCELIGSAQHRTG
jgi:hypothetical protein